MIWLFCGLVFLTGTVPTFSQSKTWNFDKEQSTGLAFRVDLTELTGQGEKARGWLSPIPPLHPNPMFWLKTSTDATDYRFPLGHCGGTNYKDVDLSVRVKAISGSVDQGGGAGLAVSRCQQLLHPPSQRPLEDNVVLYKVDNGKRTNIKPRGATDRGYGVKFVAGQRMEYSVG